MRFKIERALALVDPMGLIKIGAPFDEYNFEAAGISSKLEDGFTDGEFAQAYHLVMENSFERMSIPYLSSGAISQMHVSKLLFYIRDDVNPYLACTLGDSYKVFCNRSIFGENHTTNSRGAIATCVRKNTTTREVFFLHDGRAQQFKCEDELDESRLRWFLEDLNK